MKSTPPIARFSTSRVFGAVWPMYCPTRSSRDDLVDRKSTRLNSSHGYISYAVFCLKKKKTPQAADLRLHGRPHAPADTTPPARLRYQQPPHPLLAAHATDPTLCALPLLPTLRSSLL